MSNDERSAEKAKSNKVRTKNIGHYVLGKTLGEGTFGKVKLGVHIFTGEKVAVKILEKDKIVEVADVERVAREIYILKLIRHPNIIQLYEIIETGKQLYLIMEYASGGELFEYIVNRGKVKEQEAARFFHQIINGVNYLHNLGVVHRDLKPENLLLDHNKTMKIVDFGLSNTYKFGQKLKTACGSPCYAAPEMIAGKKYHGSNVDIWSCGVILFALICGYLPFEDPNTKKLYHKILNGNFHIPEYVSSGARSLITNILTTNPERRHKTQDIREHPWFKKYNKGVEYIDQIDSEDIPINHDVLQMLEEYRFDIKESEKYIKANKHNHETTTYYLLLKKYEKSEGKKLKAKHVNINVTLDDEDDKNLTQPPRYPQDLSVSHRIKKDYIPKNQLNQTLPATTRVQDSLSNNKGEPMSTNIPIHQVFLETSRAEQQAGINVSYDNSFSAIKNEVQKTVGNAKDKAAASANSASNSKTKKITDDLPPNKPNEAIMISESIKVNERELRENTLLDEDNDALLKIENQMNYSLPDKLHDSIDDMKTWQKSGDSRSKDRSTIDHIPKSNVGISYNEPSNAGSYRTSYQTSKPKTNSNKYAVDLPKKKGHTTNFSYSSRPKTSNYLSNGNSSQQKPQANSFMTQSIDSVKAPQRLQDHTNESTSPVYGEKESETFDIVDKNRVESHSPINIEDASSSARYSRVQKTNFRTVQETESNSVRHSDILQSEAVTSPAEKPADVMKTYRGPFSVS